MSIFKCSSSCLPSPQLIPSFFVQDAQQSGRKGKDRIQLIRQLDGHIPHHKPLEKKWEAKKFEVFFFYPGNLTLVMENPRFIRNSQIFIAVSWFTEWIFLSNFEAPPRV